MGNRLKIAFSMFLRVKGRQETDTHRLAFQREKNKRKESSASVDDSMQEEVLFPFRQKIERVFSPLLVRFGGIFFAPGDKLEKPKTHCCVPFSTRGSGLNLKWSTVTL